MLLLLLLCSYHSTAARAGDADRIYKVPAAGSQKAEAACADPQGTRACHSFKNRVGTVVRLKKPEPTASSVF
jgi:hypothetical protein